MGTGRPERARSDTQRAYPGGGNGLLVRARGSSTEVAYGWRLLGGVHGRRSVVVGRSRAAAPYASYRAGGRNLYETETYGVGSRLNASRHRRRLSAILETLRQILTKIGGFSADVTCVVSLQR